MKLTCMQTWGATRLKFGLLLYFAAASVLHAQESVAQFYKGRQITLIIPAPVGGGYDLYGRLLARYMGKYIPGNPSIVPSNMVGAAGITAAQYIYSSAAKDGTVFGEFYASALMAPLLGDPSKVKYDPLRFNYIGSASTDIDICFLRADASASTFQEALARDIILGATGGGGSSVVYPAMYINLLGAKFKVISGYPGIAEIDQAIEKGEIQGTCGASWSTMKTERPDWFTNKKMRILVQENIRSAPELSRMGIPLSTDYARSADERRVMEFVFAQSEFERPFATSPETPADRVRALRNAFTAALQDKDLRADADKMKLELDDPMTGADLQATIDGLMATTPDIVDLAKKATALNR